MSWKEKQHGFLVKLLPCIVISFFSENSLATSLSASGNITWLTPIQSYLSLSMKKNKHQHYYYVQKNVLENKKTEGIINIIMFFLLQVLRYTIGVNIWGRVRLLQVINYNGFKFRCQFSNTISTRFISATATSRR